MSTTTFSINNEIIGTYEKMEQAIDKVSAKLQVFDVAMERIIKQSGLLEFIPSLWNNITASVSTVNELVSKGHTLLDETKDRFNSVTNIFSTFNDTTDNMLRLSARSVDMYHQISRGVSDLMTKLGLTGVASGAYASGMGLVTIATRIATAAVNGLTRAIYSIPIVGWILAGISAVIALVTTLWDNCRAFRQVLFAIWEVIKLLFSNIVDQGKRIINAFITPIAAAFSMLKNLIHEWLIQPIRNAIDMIERIFNKINNYVPIKKLWDATFGDSSVTDAARAGWQKGGEHFDNEKNGPQPEDVSAELPKAVIPDGIFSRDTDNLLKGSASFNTMGAGAMERSTSFAETAPVVASGPGKSITLNIEKLIETMTFNVTYLQESKEKIKEAVTDALLTAVNDVNLAL